MFRQTLNIWLISRLDKYKYVIAAVVELVDTPDLGSGALMSVKVQVLSAAQHFKNKS